MEPDIGRCNDGWTKMTRAAAKKNKRNNKITILLVVIEEEVPGYQPERRKTIR